MQQLDFNKIIVQPVFENLCAEKKINASVLRLDLVHPVISGNKWFKLKFYLEEARRLQKKTILTFGGPWSNHILATAYACALNNFRPAAFIRGEEPLKYSATLSAAKELGMELRFIPRKAYDTIKLSYASATNDEYLIAEGGYGEMGADGFTTALQYCNREQYSHFACAAGTGTMLAGIAKTISTEQQLLGVSVLKNTADIFMAIKKLLPENMSRENISITGEYSFGGYAKHNPQLLQFMNDFFSETNIPSDKCYTAKLFWGIKDLIGTGYFPPGSNLLIIHSGGLQGNASLKKGSLIFNNGVSELLSLLPSS